MVLVNKGLRSACYNNSKQVPKSEVRLCKHVFQIHSLQVQAECNQSSDLTVSGHCIAEIKHRKQPWCELTYFTLWQNGHTQITKKFQWR